MNETFKNPVDLGFRWVSSTSPSLRGNYKPRDLEKLDSEWSASSNISAARL